jgi:hypothetical protein
MSLQTNKKYKALGFLATLFLIQGACINLSRSIPATIISEEGYFEFDATNILDQIEDGEGDLFISVEEFGEEQIELNQAWTEEETFRIIDAFREEELPAGYKRGTISTIGYFFNCDNPQRPFKNSIMRYISQLEVDGKATHTEILFIFIHPDKNHIDYAYEIRHPAVQGWGLIDMSQVHVPFEEALQIAESNGGAAIRAQLNYDCSLTSSLDPVANGQAIWEVKYYGESSAFPDLVIEIDANTGMVLSKETSD